MKSISTSVIVAMMTATLGLSAAAPALAQDAPPPAENGQAQPGKGPDRGFRPDHHGQRPGGGFDMLGFERGAEGIEIALVRLSHRLELTAEQQNLFDAFKTSALAAAADFETATEGLRPTPPVEGETSARPSVPDMLENRIALDKARLAALESVQPAASAFFESLTDEQNTQLLPQRDMDGRGPGKGPGNMHHQGPGDGPRQR